MKCCLPPCALLLLLALSARAQLPPPDPVPPRTVVPAPAAPAAAAEEDAEAEAEKPPREQTIYIPYEKLRKVFEKKGRGVFLPYEDFRRLWEQSLDRKPKEEAPEAPVAWLISEITGKADVQKEVVRFSSTISIELLKKGWHEVPLRLGDVALTKATLGGQAARIRHLGGQGYTLLIQHEAEEPKVITLQLEFSKSFTKAPGRNSVSFESPMVPVSRWDVSIPESGVKVDIHPLLAATEVPANEGAESTQLLAFVGATPSVRIEWTPKAEGAKGLNALVSVRAEQETRIAEGVARTRASLSYDISRAELTRLRFAVPKDQKVVNVFDPNVREWQVAVTGELQQVSVQLFEATKGEQVLVVELERYSDESQVPVPVIQALDVGRQQGVTAVKLATGLRAEVGERNGLLQLDTKELPPSLARSQPEFSYRYVNLPFTLSLDIDKIQPRIRVQALVEAHLKPEELQLDLKAKFQVDRAGVFKLETQLPEGFDLRGVRGLAFDGAQAVQVDRHETGPAENGMQPLTVFLSAKAQGAVGLFVSAFRPLQEPDLLSPTGKAVTLAIPVPRSQGEFVEMESGRLVVYGPESLRINPADQSGLRSIAYREALGRMPSGMNRGNERAVLSFAYADEAVSLNVQAERRAPHVTAGQLMLVQVDAGVVRFQDTFYFDVKYSGVKSLRIDVPTASADKIRIINPGIRYAVIEGAEAAEGYTPWKIEGETEFMGMVGFALHWEDKIEKLDVGKSVELVVPRLLPQDTDRAWGQIVLRKAEAIDVSPTETASGLRPIDPRYDLMENQQVSDAAQAYEFHDAWALTVKATRYEPKEVKTTSIERGLVRAVLTRSGVTSMQAVYRLLSARQRLVMKLPGKVSFDSQPLRINGRPVTLEEGAQGEYYIPLTGQESDKAFLLEVRYTVSDGGRAIMLPEFPDEPAVQQVYLSVYIPQEREYLGFKGPWNDELIYRIRGFGVQATARMDRGENWLVNWVKGDIGLDTGTLESFAYDGRHLLYSTLRPEAGPPGALHLKTTRSWLLSGIVIAVILFIGITQLRAPIGRRALIVGALLIGLVLVAVFAPSLARAVVTNATAAAALIVGIIWALHYLLVMLPKSNVFRNLMRPPKPPPAAVPAEGPVEPTGEADRGEAGQEEPDHE